MKVGAVQVVDRIIRQTTRARWREPHRGNQHLNAKECPRKKERKENEFEINVKIMKMSNTQKHSLYYFTHKNCTRRNSNKK